MNNLNSSSKGGVNTSIKDNKIYNLARDSLQTEGDDNLDNQIEQNNTQVLDENDYDPNSHRDEVQQDANGQLRIKSSDR